MALAPRARYSEATLRWWWRNYLGNKNSSFVNVVMWGRSMPVPRETVGAWKLFERMLDAYGYPYSRDFWTYVKRHIGNDSSKPWSLHAFGIAGDKDPRRNPYISGATWANTLFTPVLVDALLAVRTVTGMPVFQWGGQWVRSQDLMHWYIACRPSDLTAGINYDTVRLPDEENDEMIGQGARGKAVQQIQARLIVLGYLPEGEDDGIYGSKTAAAVEAYQTDQELPVSGSVGGLTAAFLIPGPRGKRGRRGLTGPKGETPDLTQYRLTAVD